MQNPCPIGNTATSHALEDSHPPQLISPKDHQIYTVLPASMIQVVKQEQLLAKHQTSNGYAPATMC